MDLTRYGMFSDTIVDVDSITSDGTSTNVLSNAKAKVTLKETLPGHGITMCLIKSADK